MISQTSVVVALTTLPDPKRGEMERRQRVFEVKVKRNGTSLDELGAAIEAAVQRIVAKHNARFDLEHS